MKISIYPIKVSKLPFKNYCYLIINEKTKESLIIDPAWEIDKIESEMIRHEAKLTNILLTHHHFDHVNLAETLAHKYNVPVRMSQTEIDFYKFTCHNLQPIDHPGVMELGHMTVNCLFTPGHTKGSISYLISNSLFSGDTLFIEGCGICSCTGGDPNSMFDSLCQIKFNISPNTFIYPGHSFGEEPGKPLSYLLENNFYLQLLNRDEFITFRMRANQKSLLSFS